VGFAARKKRKLRSERLLWVLLRTGVRLPSSPPKGYYTNTYYFKVGFAVTVWL